MHSESNMKQIQTCITDNFHNAILPERGTL